MIKNRITEQIDDYLFYKHSLGFKLVHEATVLQRFANYTLDIEYDGPLTRNIVFDWVSSGTSLDKTMGRKVEVLRPFSKYVHCFDSDAEIMYNSTYKNVHDRPTPYIYSENEVLQLMNECKTLYSPDGIRSYTVATIIGLLWSTGMRPSEPVNLTIADIDFEQQLLYIRKTKFSKERFISIDSSVVKKLKNYKLWINKKLGCKTSTDAFFYTTGGVPLTKSALTYAFKLIRPCINANPTGYPYVRLYDFRHTMACNTISRWSRQGIDINAKLHVLSTYIGHVKPEDTFWYLSATPELLELSCTKYEAMFGGDTYEN